jgi:hypothetical protein
MLAVYCGEASMRMCRRVLLKDCESDCAPQDQSGAEQTVTHVSGVMRAYGVFTTACVRF